MLKRLAILAVIGLFLTTFVGYSFAQCNADKQIKDQKTCCCCQCSCCK